MYMSNRAAESLTRNRVDDAYWFARAAISQDPHFLTAYNTLGVVYKRHGNLQEAVQRDAYYDKSHFWLAQAYYRLDDVSNARKQLAIAQRTGNTGGERELYAAKLAWLTSSGSH